MQSDSYLPTLTCVSEEKDTIEDVYEPFLIQGGYINRTPRGRQATPLAYQHFGLPAPRQAGLTLPPDQPKLL